MEHPLVLFLAPEITLNAPACMYRHPKMDYRQKGTVGNKEFPHQSYQSRGAYADFWLSVCHMKHNYEVH